MKVLFLDILCDSLPAKIPTHTEYTDALDDGTVVAASLTYPSHSRTQSTRNSTLRNIDLPRNFLANLT